MARDKRIVAVTVDDVEKRRIPNKHYVYVITVTWSDGNVSIIYRRYSSFFEFQTTLLDSFALEAGKTNPADRIIPFLPGKIIFGRSHVRDVALKRLEHINLYCKQLVELPRKISEADQVIEFFEPTNEDLVPPTSRGSNISDVIQAKSISEPVLLQQYQVLSSYKKEGASEVSLQAGELVDVVEKNQTGWWFVSGDDGQGWVPSSYLDQPEEQDDDDSVDNSAADRPHLATKSYTPEYSDEVALEHGAVVEVLQKNLDGWWQVRSKGKEGLVPGSYLTRADTLRAKRIQGALDDFNSQGTSASRGRTNDGAADGVRSNDVPSSGPVPATRHVRPAPVAPAVRENSEGYRQKESSSSAGDSHIEALKHRQAKDARGHHGAGPGSSRDEQELVYAKPPPPRRRTVKKMVNSRPPEHVEVEKDPDYVTVASFANHAGDGISFQAGVTVKVLDKHTGGWWFVSIDGQEGWAPSDYIHRAKQEPKSSGLAKEKVQKPQAKIRDARAKPLPPLPERPKTPEQDYNEDTDYVNEMPKRPEPPPLPTKGIKPAAKPPGNRSGHEKPKRKPKSDGSESVAQQAPKSNIVAELANNIRKNKHVPSQDDHQEPATRSQNIVGDLAKNIRSKQHPSQADYPGPAVRTRQSDHSSPATHSAKPKSIVAEIANGVRNRDSVEPSSASSTVTVDPNKNLVAQLADNIRSKQATGDRAGATGLRHKFEQNW